MTNEKEKPIGVAPVAGPNAWRCSTPAPRGGFTNSWQASMRITTMNTTETIDIRAAEIADLMERLASQGKTVTKIEVTHGGHRYKCTVGPWPRKGTFPQHQHDNQNPTERRL
jgi:hypothetical protein